MPSYLLEAIDTLSGRPVARQEVIGATLADLSERARELGERLGVDVQVEAQRLEAGSTARSALVWVVA